MLKRHVLKLLAEEREELAAVRFEFWAATRATPHGTAQPLSNVISAAR